MSAWTEYCAAWTEYCAARAAHQHAMANAMQKDWDAERAYARVFPHYTVKDSNYEQWIEGYTASALHYERLAKGETK